MYQSSCSYEGNTISRLSIEDSNANLRCFVVTTKARNGMLRCKEGRGQRCLRWATNSHKSFNICSLIRSLFCCLALRRLIHLTTLILFGPLSCSTISRLIKMWMMSSPLHSYPENASSRYSRHIQPFLWWASASSASGPMWKFQGDLDEENKWSW